MSSVATLRLAAERREWRKDHPIGFWARPSKKKDGSTNLMLWNVGIPGKKGTSWEGGVFKLSMQFSNDFPARPPVCTFVPVIFHPNVYSTGRVCLSILDERKDWKPSITLKQILLGVQDLLDNPNVSDPAQVEAKTLFCNDKEAYHRRVREQAMRNNPAYDRGSSADDPLQVF